MIVLPYRIFNRARESFCWMVKDPLERFSYLLTFVLKPPDLSVALFVFYTEDNVYSQIYYS